MALTLAPEIERLIAEKVESGLYGSPDEVIREAFRLLENQDVSRQAKLEALRAEIRVGLEAAAKGQVAPLDWDEVRAEGLRLRAERNRG